MEKSATFTGFVYLWFDSETKMYYLGSHKGSIDDGYLGSNSYFQAAYKKRPHCFKRRILEYVVFFVYEELRNRENYWLSMIKPEELGIKYFNFKKVAAGGNIISNLSDEKRKNHAIKSGAASKKYWDNISDDEYLKRQKQSKNIRFGKKFGPLSEEVRQKIKNANLGEKNHFFGKIHTQEAKLKMSLKKLGQQFRLGIKHSEVTKRLISKNNPNRKKIKTPFGEFSSIENFEKEIGFCVRHIFLHYLDRIITPYQIKKSNLFKEENVGYTPRQLGYDYVN